DLPLPFVGDHAAGGGGSLLGLGVHGLAVERTRGELPGAPDVAVRELLLAPLGEFRGAGAAGDERRGQQRERETTHGDLRWRTERVPGVIGRSGARHDSHVAGEPRAAARATHFPLGTGITTSKASFQLAAAPRCQTCTYQALSGSARPPVTSVP